MRGSPASDSRDAWKVVASVLPAIAFELSPDGRVLFVNDLWYERTGITRDQLLERAWRETVHPDDLARGEMRLGRSLATGELYEDEVRLRMGDGTYRLFRSSARAARDADGAILAWYGIAIDIEDREVARRSLGTTESALAALIAGLPLMVWTADETGWIDWYNDRWFEYTGQTPEEAAGWGWQSAHHPDDFPRVMEAWPRSIETGAPFQMEFRLRGADGVYRWFLTRIIPVRDPSGRIVRWYGSNTEIEDHKRALERSSAVARALHDAFASERLPTTDGLRFDGVYSAAEQESLVGGDWYDVVALPDGRVVVSCGDVVGHGVAASVSAGRLRQSLLVSALDGDEPAEILRRANTVLRFQESTIATCAVALVDPRDLTFSYALAGHPPPIVAFSASEVRTLPYSDAPPLGVVEAFEATTRRVTLLPDAVVVFYSDGLTEFEREIDRAEQRLREAARSLVGSSIGRPALAIQDAVMAGAISSDDIAILVMQCAGAAGNSLPERRTTLVKHWRFHSSDARIAQASRRELMTFLGNLADDSGDLYGAELILGEILANTVEHAPGLVEITIDWTETFPELAVRDRGPGIAAPVTPPTTPLDPLSEDGRGIFLMSALARELRIETPGDGGTRIVAVLPLARRAFDPSPTATNDRMGAAGMHR